MSSVNAVWYAESYHPVQAGSIDGTDVLPHDNAIYRAQLSSSLALYDPFGDPKVMGDPYCTVFVGRIPRHTEEETLKQVMNKYGRVKSMRLVRDIVTGASRGYAFVEYESEREMRCAYEDAHHTIIDGNEVLVDYYRQQLMPGWIPRRLGGGLGGKKESGQLRFGGRERPFRAPLRPIPYDELKRLGIPPPPEGHYMSRFKVPSPPRRKKDNRDDYEELSSRHKSQEREDSNSRHKSEDREEDHSLRGKSHDRGYYDTSRHKSYDREDYYSRHNSKDREDYNSRHKSKDREESRSRHNRSKERDKDRKSTHENYRYKRQEPTHRYDGKVELELETSYKSNYEADLGSRERSKGREGSSYYSCYEHNRSEDSKTDSYNKRRRSQKEREENAYEYNKHRDDY